MVDKFIFLIPLFWFLWWEVFLSQEMPSVSSLKPCFHFLADWLLLLSHLSICLSHHPCAGYPIVVSTGVVLGCENRYDEVVEKYSLASLHFFWKKQIFKIIFYNEQVKEILLKTGKTKNIEKPILWYVFSRVSRFFSLLSKSGRYVTWINCADALPSGIGQIYRCILLFQYCYVKMLPQGGAFKEQEIWKSFRAPLWN